MFGLCSDCLLEVTMSEWLDVGSVFQMDMACTEKRVRGDFLAILRAIQHLDLSPWKSKQNLCSGFGDDWWYIRLIEGCPYDYLLWMRNRNMSIRLCISLMESDVKLGRLLRQYSQREYVFPFVDRLSVGFDIKCSEYLEVLNETIYTVFPNATANVYMEQCTGEYLLSSVTPISLSKHVLAVERVQWVYISGCFWFYDVINCDAIDSRLQAFLSIIAPKLRAFTHCNVIQGDGSVILPFLSTHCPNVCNLLQYLNPKLIGILLRYFPQLGQLRELSFMDSNLIGDVDDYEFVSYYNGDEDDDDDDCEYYDLDICFRLGQPLVETPGIYEFLREIHLSVGEKRPAAAYLSLAVACFRICHNVENLVMNPIFAYHAKSHTIWQDVAEICPMISFDFDGLQFDASLNHFDKKAISDLVASFFTDLATCMPPVKSITISEEEEGRFTKFERRCMQHFFGFLKTSPNAQTVEKLCSPNLVHTLLDLKKLGYVFPQVKILVLKTFYLNYYRRDDSHEDDSDSSIAEDFMQFFPNLESFIDAKGNDHLACL